MIDRLEPIMLRPRDVAVLLSLSRSEVYRKIASGEIPAVRFGRSVRVPRRWVEEKAGVS